MNAQTGLERCLSFINCQLRSNGKDRNVTNGSHVTVVTISRQTGCGARAIAEKLAEHLQARSPKDAPLWSVFDRDLVNKVLEEHNLPQRLAKFMPENRVSEISDTIDDLFGLHPPSWLLVRKTAETILHLAKLGNVILIGRGANIITAKLDCALHVRLVGSIPRRLQRIEKSENLERKAALELIQSEDQGRRRYLRKYYAKDINDPLLYHLVINTDLVDCNDTARLIGDFVLERDHRGRAEHPHGKMPFH
jgi:cytidylate kinase